MLSLILSLLFKTMLWFHSAYRLKKTPSFSWFLRLCLVCPLFPSLDLSHTRVPLAFLLWRGFYGHCPLSLKSSSLTFLSRKSLFLFRPHVNHLIFRGTFSTSLFRLSLLYSLSGRHVSLRQTIIYGCNFTYICTIFFFWEIPAVLQIVNFFRTRDCGFFCSLYGLCI